jgi:hypothetical protein
LKRVLGGPKWDKAKFKHTKSENKIATIEMWQCLRLSTLGSSFPHLARRKFSIQEYEIEEEVRRGQKRETDEESVSQGMIGRVSS